MHDTRTSSKLMLICSVLFLSMGHATRCAEVNNTTTKADFWKKNPELKHYVAHGFTGLATFTACVIGAIASKILMSKISEKHRFKNIADNAITTTCVLACLYATYKTPQWTDTYLLKNNKQRTTKQKIVNFLNRLYIIPPWGCLTGEFCCDMLEEVPALEEQQTPAN